jgi:type III restriction enzyme
MARYGRTQWQAYAQAQGIPTVHPALIIQVQDGSSDGVSRTNLDEVIATIEKETGPIDPAEIAHCFEHDAPLVCPWRADPQD